MLLRSTRIPSSTLAPSRAFARDEEGAATIVGLIFFTMMLIAGGVALDLMRSERDRAELQYAMDRATLAAAALNQEREPKDVVEDYLRAAGVDPGSVRIQTHKTDEVSRVTIRGDSSVDSLFLQALGHDTVEAPVWSQAREEELRVEVSLVLDISGSMGWNNKLQEMRREASDFVAALLEDREELTSISIVPYNDRVNLGSTFGDVMPLSDEHDVSRCVVFEQDDFLTTGLGAGTVLQRMGSFDWRNSSNPPGPTRLPHCRTNDYGAILPWSNDVTALQGHIQALGAGDWTAMDLGVKWGAMLLDPTLRDEHASLIASGEVSDLLAGRPYDYDEPRVKKVLVVMTDGANTTQWDLKDYAKNGPTGIFAYNPVVDISTPTASTNNALPQADGTLSNSGISPVSNWSASWTSRRDIVGIGDRTGWWASPERGLWTAWDADNNNSGTAWYTETQFSIWSPSKGQFYLPHTRQYSDVPAGGVAAAEISYQELYSTVSIRFMRDKWFQNVNTSQDNAGNDGLNDLRIDSSTRNHFVNAYRQTHNASSADANLRRICQAAGDAGVIIYTIAFEAPSNGKTAMEDCAGRGREGYYYDVDSKGLDDAFDQILASINLLKLSR